MSRRDVTSEVEVGLNRTIFRRTNSRSVVADWITSGLDDLQTGWHTKMCDANLRKNNCSNCDNLQICCWRVDQCANCLVRDLTDRELVCRQNLTNIANCPLSDFEYCSHYPSYLLNNYLMLQWSSGSTLAYSTSGLRIQPAPQTLCTFFADVTAIRSSWHCCTLNAVSVSNQPFAL